MTKTSFCAFGRSCNLFIAAVALIAANATTASAVPPSPSPSSSSSCSSSDEIPSGLTSPQKQLMQRRIANAKELIDESAKIKAQSQAFHQHAQLLIAQAQKLKGEAEYLHANLTPPPTVKLNPAQLKAAQSSYKSHIDEFRTHAEAYQTHLDDFRKTVGECHANQVAYQTFANQVTLHVAQFHIPVPDVRPPHVCGRLGMTGVEMMHTANAMAGDIKRVEQSEADLQIAQNKLQGVEALSPGLDNKAVGEAAREQKEQALAGEFGKLREEYDLLKAEGNILAKNGKGFGGSGEISRASVSGKVKQQ